MSTAQREEVLEILRRHKPQFAARYELTALGVFGSVARGEAGPGSDVDIVYVTDAPNLFRAARMKQELEHLLACSVDIVRLRERMNPRLRQRILREARYV
ncbi:MAG: nucleotidyltransferase family protein [Anaerolineales bacterium]|mgnify:CR=1|nr:nucleotidyltransferase family protein [Anaerolineales bacterium]